VHCGGVGAGTGALPLRLDCPNPGSPKSRTGGAPVPARTPQCTDRQKLAEDTTKKLDRLSQRRDKHINFFARIVEINAGSSSRLCANVTVQRLGAVVSGTNGNARLIQNCG
jgi:hypothetical protein